MALKHFSVNNSAQVELEHYYSKEDVCHAHQDAETVLKILLMFALLDMVFAFLKDPCLDHLMLLV